MTTDGRAAPLPTPARLWALGVVEAVTFALLLVVVLDGNHPGLRAAAGFVHGCVYLASLGVAWRFVSDGHARGLAVIPGVGALLMARELTRPGLRRRP